MSNPDDLDERIKNWANAGKDLAEEYLGTVDKMDEETKKKYRDSIANARQILDELLLRK